MQKKRNGGHIKPRMDDRSMPQQLLRRQQKQLQHYNIETTITTTTTTMRSKFWFITLLDIHH